MISLDRLNQSKEERDIRDDEVAKVIRWLNDQRSYYSDAESIILNLKRSAHRV